MSKTREEFWMDEARKFESWFYRANYMRTQQEADNVALRKLLRDTLPFIAEEADYCVPNECFMYPACCEDTPDAVCLAVVRIHERARELGVEP